MEKEITINTCIKQYKLLREREVKEDSWGCLNCDEVERMHCIDYKPLGECYRFFENEKKLQNNL